MAHSDIPIIVALNKIVEITIYALIVLLDSILFNQDFSSSLEHKTKSLARVYVV